MRLESQLGTRKSAFEKLASSGDVASTSPVARPSNNHDEAAVVNRISAEDVMAETRDPTNAVALPMSSHF